MNSLFKIVTLFFILILFIVFCFPFLSFKNYSSNNLNLLPRKNRKNELGDKIGGKLNEYLLNDSEWSEILRGNSAQKAINSKIILKTIKFMISETEEEDPKLIDFVKSLINLPSNDKLKLVNPKRKDFSQHGESLRIDKMLNGTRNGFLVEAGALDGETISNSLFFERERNWSGILIEPLPLSYQRILKKNRKMYSINACIAKKTPMVAKFRMYKSGAYSGRNKIFSPDVSKKIPSEFQNVYVPCFSLQTILSAINVKKVDFFSLDVEGGEWDVLKSIDFEKLNIKSFIIEFIRNSKEELANFLIKKNYTWHLTDKSNIYMIKQ